MIKASILYSLIFSAADVNQLRRRRSRKMDKNGFFHLDAPA